MRRRKGHASHRSSRGAGDVCYAFDAFTNICNGRRSKTASCDTCWTSPVHVILDATELRHAALRDNHHERSTITLQFGADRTLHRGVPWHALSIDGGFVTPISALRVCIRAPSPPSAYRASVVTRQRDAKPLVIPLRHFRWSLAGRSSRS